MGKYTDQFEKVEPKYTDQFEKVEPGYEKQQLERVMGAGIGAEPLPEKMGPGEAFLEGGAQGITLGFGDEAAAAVDVATSYIGDVFGDMYETDWERAARINYEEVYGKPYNPQRMPYGERYDARLKERRESYEKAEEDQPFATGAGEISGLVATSVVPGSWAARSATPLKAAAIEGGGTMAMYGAGKGETMEERAKLAALYGLTGAAGAPATRLVGAGIQKGKEIVSKVGATRPIAALTKSYPELAEIPLMSRLQKLTTGQIAKTALPFAASPTAGIGMLAARKALPAVGSMIKKVTPESVQRVVGGTVRGTGEVLKKTGPAVPTAGAVVIDPTGTRDEYADQFEKVPSGVSKINSTLDTNPEYFGKYTQTLQEASARGTDALISTDFILKQQNPEYNELSKKLG